MIEHPLVVIALDACDLGLAEYWDCDNLLLDQYQHLDSYAHSTDVPYTLDVWPTVATGKHIEDLTYDGAEPNWESPTLAAASKAATILPDNLRTQLGAYFVSETTEHEVTSMDADHVFDRGAIYGWPGITGAPHLEEAWTTCSKVIHDDLDTRKAERDMLGNFGEEIGWAYGTARACEPIVGVHCHLLDVFGHCYGRSPDDLRHIYEHADEAIGMLRDQCPRLTVLSDHGMQVRWLDDDEPGKHSWRSMISATDALESPLPGTVFDVRGWLESQVGEYAGAEDELEMDASREQLQALGYISE